MPEGSTCRGREEVYCILLHITVKLRTLSKNFVIFPYCNMGGGGTIKKMRPPQKERKKHKKV